MYKLVSINHDRYSFHCMQLSWIRQRDLHVLTHATVSYTSEKRFSVHHNLPNDDWELRISSTEARDAGFYECQVNTEPKLHWPIYLQVYSKFLSIAHHQPLVYHHQSIIPDYEEQLGAFILILVYRLWLPQLPPPSLSLSLSLYQSSYLSIFLTNFAPFNEIKWKFELDSAAQAIITGPSEVHVRQGSTLSLTCSLEGPQDSESALDWYHNDQRIDLENVRGAISLATERRDHFTKSRLLIPRADVHHGGNYTCVPTQALPVTVLVHVLNGTWTFLYEHLR